MSNYFSSEGLPKFDFYFVPQALFTNNELNSLSNDAKLLYGLMLSRLNLSIKNKWLDNENHAYIYFTIKSTRELLNCCNDKCCKIFEELESLKLINRKIQGFGKPAKIYVMNFNAINKSGKGLKYDYFSIEEIKKLKFYRVPKELFSNEFKKLSNNAKLVYGLMLDRLNLSIKNKWLDKEGNPFINFSIKELSKLLNCCNKTCSNLISMLKKVGLIRYKLQGLGKPALIYIKNFVVRHRTKKVVVCKNKGKILKIKRCKNQNLRHVKNGIQDTKKIEVLTSKNQNLKQEKNGILDMQKLECKRTYKEFNNTNLKQQQEKNQNHVVVKLKEVLSFIKEPLTEKELQLIFNIANNNIQLIKEKYDIMKTQNVRNIIGFLISAIKNDFQQPKSYVKVNKFVNYEQRKWNFDELEKMERERITKDLQKIKREAENNIDKNTYNQKLNEIKSKVNYEQLVNEFSNCKNKIDSLINVLAKSISSSESYIFYDCRTITKSKTAKTIKGLNYTHMKDVILHSFNKNIPDILIDLADFCTAINY